MKKVLAILPLMTAVFLAPSCKVTIGWDDTKFEYVTSVNGKEATVEIRWTSGDRLSFKTDKLAFTTNAYTLDKVFYDDLASTVNPKIVKITFEEDITENFSGRLDYTYTNNNTGANGDNQVELTFEVK